ncbi:MAG: sensor histidine kinase [Solirubrobacterales bacterium]
MTKDAPTLDAAEAQQFGKPIAHNRLHRATALTLTIFPIATMLAVIVFVGGGPGNSTPLGLLALLIVAIPAAMGWTITRLRPGNAIGWLLMGHATLLTLGFLTDIYPSYSVHHHSGTLPGTALVAYASNATWPVWFAGMTAIAFVFPDGHLPSPRWRKWAWAAGFAFVIHMVVSMFDHDPLPSPYQHLQNPLPKLPVVVLVIGYPFVLGILASLFAAAFAVRARLKRAVGTERLQILWLAYAALTLPGAVLLCWTDTLITGGIGTLTTVGVVFMVAVVPLAIGIGILRHQLFDIELVINRTLVYGSLTIFVVAAYIGVVAGFGSLIGNRDITGVIVAGLVAVLIQPLHAHLQKRVDRWIYGDRSDPYAALQRLGGRLRETLAPDEVVQTVVDSVAEALRLPYVAVEFEREGGVEVTAAHGERGNGRIERRDLIYRGESVGRIAAEVPPGHELAAADRRLLDDLAGHAGAAVQSVRLTVDLQRSRERLVTAREEERRRLRRDLHDGIGPALAAMVLKLDAARRMVDRPDAEDLLKELRDEAQEAITDIRRLVYGLRPPALDEVGLIPALMQQAARLSSDGGKGALRISVTGPVDPVQLPAAIEVAAYRIALEAMTNVTRHARARGCTVEISLNGSLELVIADDGVGLRPDCAAGVGMSSMRERAEELGGSCAILTPAAGGTVVTAILPLVDAPVTERRVSVAESSEVSG